MEYKDYYRILGIPRDADEQTIKSAYRRMARAYHPDVNPDKAAATEKFKEINEAYTVLSDADKRRRYDSFGASYEQYRRTNTQSGASPRPGTASSGSWSGAGGAQRSQSQDQGAQRNPNWGAQPNQDWQRSQGAQREQSRQRSQAHTIDPEDFERIFRGFAWTFGSAAADASSSGDFSDFFEALFGGRWSGAAAAPATRDIDLDLPITLEEAFSGAKRTLRYGDGRRIEVNVPPGVDTGSRLRIRGEGERAFGRPRGDLYLHVEVSPHPVFTRTGNDLRVKVSLDEVFAVHSGQVQVPTLERPVMLKIPAGTQTGRLFRLAGLGMPALQDPTTRGDLLVEVMVKAPAPKPQPGPAPKATAKGTPKAQPRREPQRAAVEEKSAGLRYAQLAGIALVAGGLVGIGFQVVSGGALAWLILLALGLILLSQAVWNRSFMLTIAGLGALLGGAWFASQTGLAPAGLVAQGWPLILLTLGLLLLPSPHRARRKT